MLNWFGLSLLALLGGGLLLGQTGDGPNRAQTVVFVCEHGAAKCIIAAAEFNRRAEQSGLPQRAISRGTNPDPMFAPGVAAGLKKDGLGPPAGKPQLVTENDILTAARVITLGCKLPERLNSPTKTTDWPSVPAPSANYDAARQDIARHVEQLIQELIRERTKK